MNIAIVGAGRIGTTFGFHLAKAGHSVTLVARGKRLDELRQSRAIETVGGQRVEVQAAERLDPATPWDLVVVTVLAHQVDAVLPDLAKSAAKIILFMFNTVEPLGRLRDAVGVARFEFAFPTVIAFFENGKLRSTVAGPGNVTTASSARIADVFNAAKIPAVVHADMESWLRSHAAFVVPLMTIACQVSGRGRGLSFAEARRYARMLDEGFAAVKKAGNALTPAYVAVLARLPALATTPLLWAVSRTSAVRDLGTMGPAEPRVLIDGLSALAPGATPELLALRP